VLITSSPASLSTPGGTPVTATLTLVSLAGYSLTTGANVGCDIKTVPYYSECTLVTNYPGVPMQIICAPTGKPGDTCTGISTAVLTISSNIPVNVPPTATANVQAHGAGSSPLIPAGIFGIGLFGLALRRREIFNRRLLNGVVLLLMLAGVAMSFGGCTNSSYTKTPVVKKYTTAPGTYNISIQVSDPTTGVVVSPSRAPPS